MVFMLPFSTDMESSRYVSRNLDRSRITCGSLVWAGNSLWVVDSTIDQIVNILRLDGQVSDDLTPDLLAVSPNGSNAFMSLRGPIPLTADPHVSTGSTSGVGVLKVTQSGRDGFEAVARVSNVDAPGFERADGPRNDAIAVFIPV